MVAQVDEQQPTVIALGVYPAGQPRHAAKIASPQGGAMVGAVLVSGLIHGRERNDAPDPVKPGPFRCRLP